MRIKEIIPEGYVGQTSPIQGSRAIPKKKRAAQQEVEELVNEGPIWDKTKKVAAGAVIAGAALGSHAAGDTTKTFSADASTPQFEQMQELASIYYSQVLEKAKLSGVMITSDMLRRMRNEAQTKAIRELSK